MRTFLKISLSFVMTVLMFTVVHAQEVSSATENIASKACNPEICDVKLCTPEICQALVEAGICTPAQIKACGAAKSTSVALASIPTIPVKRVASQRLEADTDEQAGVKAQAKKPGCSGVKLACASKTD